MSRHLRHVWAVSLLPDEEDELVTCDGEPPQQLEVGHVVRGEAGLDTYSFPVFSWVLDELVMTNNKTSLPQRETEKRRAARKAQVDIRRERIEWEGDLFPGKS